MKTKLLLLALLILAGIGRTRAADDPFASIRATLAQNEFETAEAALAPLVSAENPAPRAWFFLSQIRARQGKTKEAVELAEKAVAAAPQEAEFHSNLGMLLSQRIGEVNFINKVLLAGRMLESFEKSVTLDPEHLAGYIGLARYYTHAPSIAGGGREPAERYAREVEKRNVRLGTIELALVAEHFGDQEQAYALFSAAAAAQPDAGWIQEALGRVGEKLGRPEAARTHYEKALALDPSRNAAREALARLSPSK